MYISGAESAVLVPAARWCGAVREFAREAKSLRGNCSPLPRSDLASRANTRQTARHHGAESLRQAVNFLRLGGFAFQQIVGAQAQVQCQSRRNVNRRIGAGENADHQGGGKRMQGLAAEEQ